MWWARKSVWTVYVDSAGAWSAPALRSGLPVERHASAVQAVARAASARRVGWARVRVSVLLSGALARPLMVGPIAGLKTWAEAVTAADMAAVSAVDLEGPCEARLEGWPGDHAALATAVRRQQIDDLYAAADAADVRLASIRPWWAQRAAEWMSTHHEGIVVVVDSEAMTLLGAKSGRIDMVGTYSPLPELGQRHALMRRVAQSHGSDAAAVTLCSLTHLDTGSEPWPSSGSEDIALDAV